ncbi:MAG: hypothetical protein WA708_08865 [Acidobacteriaceae bacterium]
MARHTVLKSWGRLEIEKMGEKVMIAASLPGDRKPGLPAQITTRHIPSRRW